MDEYLEITRTSKREETLRQEVHRLRNSFSFQFGNIFVQAIERPILLFLLPFNIIAFLYKRIFNRKKDQDPSTNITRNCILGYSAESHRNIHFDRMERILAELRTYGIQTVHVTNDKGIRMPNNTKLHSIYFIPSRVDFDDMIPRTWNRKIEQIVSGILDTFHPRTMIFDGDYPFRGILNAISLRPEMNRFWVRESMLNFKISSLPIDGFDIFDAIIHPTLTRRDDPDSIIGGSGTIFCNPIIGQVNSKQCITEIRERVGLKGKQLIFSQISNSIINRNEVFERLLAQKGAHVLCFSTSIPKQYKHHLNVTIIDHLSTHEAIQASDVCVISPDFFNIYSVFSLRKPTLCVAESKLHLDSIQREFATQTLPIVLIGDENDGNFIGDGIERLMHPELQQQLIERMEGMMLADGTSELCDYINKLHETNQLSTGSSD